jgi:uncharacterized protein YbcI
MTVRTLAEAAADVLRGTQAGGAKEPMHKLPNTGSGLDSVTDLGGATFEDPQGGDVGKAAGNMVGKAAQPGKSGAAADPSKGTVADVTKSGTNDTDLASSMNKTVKTKMQPVSGGAMAEETDEEEETIDSSDESDEDEVLEEGEEESEELTEEEIEAARKARWDDLREKMKAVPVSEDMEALFSGETLSEEFKTKAQAIYEAAVITRAMTVLEPAEKEILEAAEAAIDETRAELEEKVESYLNFVVEQWVGENQVAIESGLRTEAVESFIKGLKDLFVENYVDVPEDKVDLVAAQEEQIAELTAKVNEALNANIELTAKLQESKKSEILNTVCEGLTATQAEKVKTLAEGVEFTTEGEFSKKVGIIRESYVNTKVKDGQVALTEQTGPAEIEEAPVVDRSMQIYTDAISRIQK